MGIVLFVLDNGSLGIMEQGLPIVIPEYSSSRYHHDLARIDFGAMARACGWMSYKLKSDLSNLIEIMSTIYRHGERSILIEVPVVHNKLWNRIRVRITLSTDPVPRSKSLHHEPEQGSP
jgi:acetolactate synthase-1/2/3 large subunit